MKAQEKLRLPVAEILRMAKERDLNLWSVKLPGKLDVAHSDGESDDELQAARDGDPYYPHVKVYRQ